MAANAPPQFLTPIDAGFAQAMQAIIHQNTYPTEQRLKIAGEQLIEWMARHGRILQATGTGDTYYLWRDQKRLFKLDSDRFRSWMYLLTAVNPSSSKAKYLWDDCQAAAFDGEKVDICKLAHWDGQYLRLSSFDGNVWRLDGQTIEQEANGDGPIIFDDTDNWEPWTPDLTSDGAALQWWLELVNASKPTEQYRLGLLAYLVGVFFSELCPTRPLLLIQGEKGSGKSMVLRILLKLLFGRHEDVIGVPDREEAFATVASNSHLLVIDNLDTTRAWLRDKLARITTGAHDPMRILYKNNELAKITFRVWVAVTARTPDTLRRDDLTDRLLILPTDVLPVNIPERLFLAHARQIRAQWWGDVLNLLNGIIANIRAGQMPPHSALRMADFEALGRLVAQTIGHEPTWTAFVNTWNANQKAFLLEDSIIVDALEAWLAISSNRGREVGTRTLYLEAEEKLFGYRPNKPDQGWPKSAVWFGRQLMTMRGSLQTRFQVSWRTANNQWLYTFDVLP